MSLLWINKSKNSQMMLPFTYRKFNHLSKWVYRNFTKQKIDLNINHITYKTIILLQWIDLTL